MEALLRDGNSDCKVFISNSRGDFPEDVPTFPDLPTTSTMSTTTELDTADKSQNGEEESSYLRTFIIVLGTVCGLLIVAVAVLAVFVVRRCKNSNPNILHVDNNLHLPQSENSADQVNERNSIEGDHKPPDPGDSLSTLDQGSDLDQDGVRSEGYESSSSNQLNNQPAQINRPVQAENRDDPSDATDDFVSPNVTTPSDSKPYDLDENRQDEETYAAENR